MGFLENLRRRKEQEEVEASRVQSERVRIEAANIQNREAVRLSEEQRQARIRQERDMSEEFLRQSEFPRMAQELENLVKGIRINKRPIRLEGDKQVSKDDISRNVHVALMSGRDSYDDKYSDNMAGFSLIWYTGNRKERLIGKSNFLKEWEEMYDAVTIACDSQGLIKITKAREYLVLPRDAWRNNPQVQEEALERAYHDPMKFYFKRNNLPYERQWDGGR